MKVSDQQAIKHEIIKRIQGHESAIQGLKRKEPSDSTERYIEQTQARISEAQTILKLVSVYDSYD